jgi:glycerol-3-phosphate dehydrogenase (NAD(P)+)
MNTDAFIIGSGGWGTALGIVLAGNFETVTLWEHDQAYASKVEASRENSVYLAGVKLKKNLRFQSTEAGVEKASLVLLCTPSQYFRSAVEKFLPKLPESCLIVIATKGIEQGSLLTMSQVVEDVAKKQGITRDLRIVSLSGPSHAEEVGRELPTTVVAASHDPAAAKQCQLAFTQPWFRVYTSEDHLGVELGGSLKNVVALAAGIADGLGLGDNAKAALMTRGLAEITRLGVALGAKASSFYGLTGMGDLVVTCMSRHSRNRSVGERLGKGESWESIQAGMKMVAEGITTAVSARDLAKKAGIDMPICAQVYAVVFEKKNPALAMRELMSRELKSEA